jgi:hypothetical protein
MSVIYGECKSKGFKITPDWKCVDFRINPNFSRDQEMEIRNKCNRKDWFDVCQWCRDFNRGSHTGKIPE